MILRLIAAAVLTAFLAAPASSNIYPTKPVDEPIAAAAARLKVKDYQGARQAAAKEGGDPGAKAFVQGYCAAKLELWDEAARQMGAAEKGYPILADYALYYQGMALAKLGRVDEALPQLYKVLKEYPDSRLVRTVWLLYGDTLLSGGYFKEALASYVSFIERYPAGTDSLQALLNSALCREKLGNAAEAATVLRGIWLNYPASPVAETADQEIKRLAEKGTAIVPYNNAELLKRATTLFDLGRYLRAAQAFGEVKPEGEEAICKVQLKRGQALYKGKRYEEAEKVLTGAANGSQKGCAQEAKFWLARTLDGSGRQDDAFALFMRLADSQSTSIADDALLKAAYLKRFQRKWKEALPLFKRYLAAHPGSIVRWESAWGSFQTKDFQEAAQQFRKLAEREDTREKSLYWLGRALIALGDQKGGEAQLAQLCSEYPFGYYAYLSNKGNLTAEIQRPPANLRESLPIPAGFDREKALIGLGLYDEAAKELWARKSKNTMGVARLFLDMENYNGAYHAATRDNRKKIEKETPTLLGLRYPQAFHEYVVKNAANNALPESLVYAVMLAESVFSPTALSSVGAVGLMQIMPATAEQISQGDSSRLTRPELNIRLGTKHLKDLLKSNDGNLALAVASYNAGSGNVKKWQRKLGDLPQDEFIESIPFGETREYVKKVLSAMALYQKLYPPPEPGKN